MGLKSVRNRSYLVSFCLKGLACAWADLPVYTMWGEPRCVCDAKNVVLGVPVPIQLSAGRRLVSLSCWGYILYLTIDEIQNGQGTKNAFLRTRKQLEIAQVWCCERMLTLLHHPLNTCTY
eukprot:9500506-Pyramimonas_sp.AAC.3